MTDKVETRERLQRARDALCDMAGRSHDVVDLGEELRDRAPYPRDRVRESSRLHGVIGFEGNRTGSGNGWVVVDFGTKVVDRPQHVPLRMAEVEVIG